MKSSSTVPASHGAPWVSVVIGTYNCASWLPGLFECLERQTFRDFETVVVDDASTDGETMKALEAQGDRIRLIRRNTNSRTCELPRYQGAKEARGAYCAFLDADDRWDPTFLERTVAYLRAHPDTPMVHTAVRVVDAVDQVLRIRHEHAMPEGPDLARRLLEHCYITVSAVVVRRDVWLQALREVEINDFGMDLDFFLSIAQRYPVGFIPDVLASYRRSESSVSVQKWRRIPRNVVTLERIYRKGLWRGIAPRKEMRRILADAYMENAQHHYFQGYPDRVPYFAARGWLHRPQDLRFPTWILRAFLKRLARARAAAT